MSQEYMVSAILSDKFSYTICEKIIKKGKELGCIYLNSSFYKTQFPNEPLSAKESLHIVMEGSNFNFSFLDFKLLDDFAKLLFSNPVDSSFSLRLDPGNWKQLFYSIDEQSYDEEDTFIDNARYARLLLKLVESLHLRNFSITDMETDGYLNNLEKNILAAKIINKDDTCSRLVRNIYFNRGAIIPSFDKRDPLIFDAGIEYLMQKFPFHEHTPSELYIEIDGTLLKLIISSEYSSEHNILLQPLDPIRKKSIDDILFRDTAFYVKLLLGICEEYPILELKTTFEDCRQ